MKKLESLYEELKEVQSMTNNQVKERYNCDTKEEMIQFLKWDIMIEESKESDNDSGMDYDALCYSQGISRYC